MSQLEEKAGLLIAAPAAGSEYLDQLKKKPKLRVSKWILYPFHCIAFLLLSWFMLRLGRDLPIFRNDVGSDVGHAANKIFDFDEVGHVASDS